MTPGVEPFLTQGAWLAGFMKRIIIHCYTKKKYESSGPSGLGEDFYVVFFFHGAPGEGPEWSPGARVAGFIKRTFIHSYTQNTKALGLVNLEKKIFKCFPQSKSMGANDPWGGAILAPGAWLAGFIKKTTIHCYIQNMKDLGFVVLEKNFSHHASGAWPVGTPGTRLGEFI